MCRSPTHTLLLAPRGRMRQPFLGTPMRPLEPAPGGGKREETQCEACEGKGTPGGADSKALRRSRAGNLQGDRGPVGLPAGRCHPLQKFQELKVCGRSVLRPFCHWSPRRQPMAGQHSVHLVPIMLCAAGPLPALGPAPTFQKAHPTSGLWWVHSGLRRPGGQAPLSLPKALGLPPKARAGCAGGRPLCTRPRPRRTRPRPRRTRPRPRCTRMPQAPPEPARRPHGHWSWTVGLVRAGNSSLAWRGN